MEGGWEKGELRKVMSEKEGGGGGGVVMEGGWKKAGI